jgi:hypothetical protein
VDGDPADHSFHDWAAQRIAALLVELELASWGDDGTFRLFTGDSKEQRWWTDSYCESLKAQAAKFGGDYSRLYPPD